MKIGVDVREIRTGRYTGLRNILEAFLLEVEETFRDHEIILFADRFTDLKALPGTMKTVFPNANNTLFYDQVMLPLALKKKGVEVFFSPYIKTPLWRVCPYVNTVCDVIPLTVSRFTGVKALLDKLYFCAYAFLCSMRSVKVITLSMDAAARISEAFGLGREKIEVVYPSIEPHMDAVELQANTGGRADGHQIRGQYLLYVGNFKPHKNLRRLVSAYGLLPEKLMMSYKLVLTGGSDAECLKMSSYIRDKNLESKVISLPGVEQYELRDLYRKATAFVFPSLDEGFGMPPLEAMAYGIPVVSSETGPMREVLGDAALFFAPEDVNGMAMAIERMLSDDSLRYECVKRGKERASIFTRDVMTRCIMKALCDAGTRKTLCISSEFPPVTGGIASHMYNLWKRFPPEKVAVLTMRTPGSGYLEGMDIIRKSYPAGTDILSRTARALMVGWHILRQNTVRRIGCNHCAQVLSAGVGGLIVKKVRGTPYVVYVYSADILEFTRFFFTRLIMRAVIRGSDHIIANSRFTASLLTGNGMATDEKIKVSTPAVDLNVFTPDRRDSGIREKYGIPLKDRIILSVSRIAERKGHRDVIEAMPEILRKHPDAVYVVAGEGPLRKELETMVYNSGVEGRVIFTGLVPSQDLPALYAECEIFILVPRFIEDKGDVEGFGIVFLEANACGKPVIAGRSGGVEEAVLDGETGIVVAPGDTEAIENAVSALLGDNVLANRLGNNGVERVRRYFNWDDRARELENYI